MSASAVFSVCISLTACGRIARSSSTSRSMQAIRCEVTASNSATREVLPIASLLLLFLQAQQLALHHVGDAEPVLLGDRPAVFLQHQRAEHRLAVAAAGHGIRL